MATILKAKLVEEEVILSLRVVDGLVADLAVVVYAYGRRLVVHGLAVRARRRARAGAAEDAEVAARWRGNALAEPREYSWRGLDEIQNFLIRSVP